MRGIILKDLYEGFCIKKNLINWLVSMIFTSALTAISEFMRGAYGFLLIVVLIFPVMGSTLLQMTAEQDEKAEFDLDSAYLSAEQSEVVLSKYLGGLIVQGGMITLFIYVCIDLCVWISDDHPGRGTSDMGNRCNRRCDLLCSELCSIFLAW